MAVPSLLHPYVAQDRRERFHGKAGRKVVRAKKRARSEIKPYEWSRRCYAAKWDGSLRKWATLDTCPRVRYSQCSPEQFRTNWEDTNQPCIVVGGFDHWPACNGKWNPEQLMGTYSESRVKIGEDDEGYPVRLKLKYYFHYIHNQQDDSPLYVFEGNVGEDDAPLAQMRGDYKPLSYFTEDLFKYVGEERRPPYKWFVMGPARSGSNIHIDPLGTSAWNSLLSGHKLWALFPPNSKREHVKPRSMKEKEAITWFMTVYPAIMADPKAPKPIIALQKPGETMFVPGGWWHVVINLDHSTAVTQNFVSRSNLPVVWRKVLKGRPKLAIKWRAAIAKECPELLELMPRRKLMKLGSVSTPAKVQNMVTVTDSSSCDESTSVSTSSEPEDEEKRLAELDYTNGTTGCY
eukprot:Clim_evm40s246 gene=Clim_evmTU40s246